jgi:glycosyltransferase involved in cell wall biosynthesis
VVLEALASGRPVVASAVGGVPELLSRHNGVVVPPEDPGALAEGLREALARYWEPAALRASVESLSWDHFGRALHDLLASAVTEANGEPADARRVARTAA